MTSDSLSKQIHSAPCFTFELKLSSIITQACNNSGALIWIVRGGTLNRRADWMQRWTTYAWRGFLEKQVHLSKSSHTGREHSGEKQNFVFSKLYKWIRVGRVQITSLHSDPSAIRDVVEIIP
ncbi:hypothetical protein JTB14_005377 [Gonioctena quinquepunctata]|nr:hypothetical protein JTB14_005377 [Gonioctena quinquepunctata]